MVSWAAPTAGARASRSGTDNAQQNPPGRDLDRTLAFYSTLGFEQQWRDDGWMILERGGIVLEFFPDRQLDLASSGMGCCLRLSDVAAFVEVAMAAGVPEARFGFPRLHRPVLGGRGGFDEALVDPGGALLRRVQA